MNRALTTGMFKKLTGALETAAVRARVKSGKLVCPECGAKAESLPGKADEVMGCRECGTKASLAEWAADDSPGAMSATADTPPPGTRIRKEGDGQGGVVWHIPPSGKFGFFAVFGVLWMGITVLVSGGFLFAFLSGGKIEGGMSKWLMIPFFGVFYAIGFGFLYAALREKFMRHTISVSSGEVRLNKELFGRKKEKALARGTVKSVERKEFYQKNYQPVYGIEIKGADGKLRFGSTLEEDEKSWLVADIRQAVFGRQEVKKVPAGATGVSGSLGLRGATARQEVFSALIPGVGKGSLVGPLMFAAIGIAFVCIGIFVLDGEKMPAGSGQEGGAYVFDLVFALFGNGFRFIWLMISSLFVLIGLGMALSILMGGGSERRIEGNSTEISIRTYKRGLIVKDQSFPRNQVTDIRTSASGSSNGRTMKRIELIVGNKAERIASWVDGDAADELIEEVRAAIG